jgi:hypothetical protein
MRRLCADVTALQQLGHALRPHSGRSTTLLTTPAGRRDFSTQLALHRLSVPAPADWSLRASSETVCKVCGMFEHDRIDLDEGDQVEFRVYGCIFCNGWWHAASLSLSEQDRQSLPTELVPTVEDGAAPP